MVIFAALSVPALKPEALQRDCSWWLRLTQAGSQCSLVVVLHSKEDVDRENLENINRQKDLGHCQEKELQHLEYKLLSTRLQEGMVHKIKGTVRSS